MDYTLAVKLKEAGFPQWTTETDAVPYQPTLEELITAVGEPFMLVKPEDGFEWRAHGKLDTGVGFDPLSATANLWLSLHQ